MSCEFLFQSMVVHASGVSELYYQLLNPTSSQGFLNDTRERPLLHTPNLSTIIRIYATHQGRHGRWRKHRKNEFEDKGFVATRDVEPAAVDRCTACSIPNNGAVV